MSGDREEALWLLLSSRFRNRTPTTSPDVVKE